MKSKPSAPLSLLEWVRPRPGWLLVERLEMPSRAGSIILLEKGYVRGAEAVVVAASPELAEDWPEGQCVVLTGGVTRQMRFGDGDEQRVIELATPRNVCYRLHRRVKVDKGEHHWQRGLSAAHYEAGDVEGWEEGERFD